MSAVAANSNMYRVGDYVYVDAGPNEPFGVRRIDELQKSAATGNVEAEVMIYYRRIDLPADVITVADENLAEYWDEMAKKYPTQVHERELFLAKKTETISATQIRGKCTVSLLHKAESLFYYIKTDDSFFYTLVYDAVNKSLFEDRGEIKIGHQYQAEVPLDTIRPEDDTRKFEDLEELCWSPEHSLADKQIDQFLVIARSVGTFARAVDEASTLKQPSLHMSAAAASRDITLFHAMDLLHCCRYDFARAALALVDHGAPRLSTDQMEEWTTAESALFEEAMEKYGKGFNDIWTDFLPWKTVKNLVEYYYMWKTTDRYVQQKRVKAVESEHKLKQVYVPDYAKLGDGAIPGHQVQGAMCLSCRTTQANSWYDMPGAHLLGMSHCKICQTCWMGYRKYSAMTPGGMSRDLGGSGGGNRHSGGGSKGKKATTLFLMPTLVARIARKLPSSSGRPRDRAPLNVRRLGRKPFRAVDQEAVRRECCRLMAEQPPAKIKRLLARRRYAPRRNLAEVTVVCGYRDLSRPAWLIPMAKDLLPQPVREAFPRRPGGTRLAAAGGAIRAAGPVSLNRIKVAAAARAGSARNASGVEIKSAPEDIFFRASRAMMARRNSAFSGKVLKKLARRPTKLSFS